MYDAPSSPRRYTEKEVRRLLKRASDLQRTVPSAPNPRGLTLTELEEVAAEAGLDPALLRRAAAELDGGNLPGAASGLGSALAGSPLEIVLERALPGEIPPSGFASLIPILQVAAEAPGQASQVGTTLTWHSQNPSNPRSLQILISVKSGHTVVRIEERYGGLAGGLFGGLVGGVGGGVGLGGGGALAGVLGSATLAFVLPTTIIMGTYLATRRLFRSMVHRRRRALEALMQDIGREISDSIGDAGASQIEHPSSRGHVSDSATQSSG